MKPKKKSNLGFYLAIVTLVATLFIAIHAAGAFHDIGILQEQDTPEVHGFNIFDTFFERLGSRIAEPFNFEWYEQSQTMLIVCFAVWFLTVAYIATSQKNFISGKEYGTAKWGGINDIKDLFAINILKEEISKARKAAFPLARYLYKKKVFKDAVNNGRAMFLEKITVLDDKMALFKNQGMNKNDINEKYNREKEAIKKEVDEFVLALKREGWKPLKIKDDYEVAANEFKNVYDNEVAVINNNFEMYGGSSLFSMERHNRRLDEAKAKYDKGLIDANEKYKNDLKAFYSKEGKVKVLRDKYLNADALLTKSERTSIYNFKINNNILIIGGSSSGKSRGFGLPNLLQAHSSFVITDPKGEILEKCGKFLKEFKGYDIRVLNLDNKALSDGYNPFAYIYPERAGYEERVLELIEAIIINTDGGEKRNSNDPFWDKAERLFLQAIFFFVCELSPKDRNMNSVLKFIQQLKIEEERDNLDSDLDFFAEKFAYGRYRDSFMKQRGYKTESEKKNEGRSDADVDDERVVAGGRSPDHIGYQQYIEFRSKASGKTAKSIVISAVARLAPFRTKEVRRIFSYDTMNLQELGENKMAIFVVVPPTTTAYNFIAGILFTQMFQELQYCATEKHKHNGQKLPVPVRFILDEFANTCTIPNFVKILAYARSFGIGIIPILQSLEQIKNLYKDEWQVIVDNCSTRLFLGSISSIDTLEYVSKMIGKGTFDKKTTGRTRSKHGSGSTNYDVIGRELMDAAELSKLPKDECILLISGRNPFYSKKYEYTEHPNYRFTSDANDLYAYDHTPMSPTPICENPVISSVTETLKSTHGEYISRSENDIAAFVAPQRVEFDTTDPEVLLKNLASSKNIVPFSNDDLTEEDIEVFDVGKDILFESVIAERDKEIKVSESVAFDFMASLSDTTVSFVKDPAVIGAVFVEGLNGGTIATLSNDDLGEASPIEILDDDIEALELYIDDNDAEADLVAALNDLDVFNDDFIASIEGLGDEFRDTVTVGDDLQKAG